jgi:L-iditol 2-dehydrogenase
VKALLLREYNRLCYEDVLDPTPAAHEVLVQVKACGICGSDVHGLDGSTGRRVPPLIMGHEAAGVIAAVGEGVTDWHGGDRVTFDSTLYCGACWYCRRGEINLCERRRVLGVSCDEYRQHGAFAEHVAVPQHLLYRLPDDLTFVRASLVEPLAVALHAVSLTPVRLNDTAVVMGAGVIGLLIVQVLRAAGCGNIFAVDLDAGRLALARQLGADHTVRPGEGDLLAEVLAATKGRGADIAFDAVGLGPVIETGVRSLRKGGALTLVGNLAPRIELPLQVVVARQLRLQGCCASSGEYPTGLAMMARGAVNVDPLTSATAPLSEGAAWFSRLQAGEPGLLKVVLTP